MLDRQRPGALTQPLPLSAVHSEMGQLVLDLASVLISAVPLNGFRYVAARPGGLRVWTLGTLGECRCEYRLRANGVDLGTILLSRSHPFQEADIRHIEATLEHSAWALRAALQRFPC